MIDQPQFFVPHQHIGITERAVHVGQERIQPDNTGSLFRTDLRHHRVKRQSA
mgnify:CR=1 FL=1